MNNIYGLKAVLSHPNSLKVGLPPPSSSSSSVASSSLVFSSLTLPLQQVIAQSLNAPDSHIRVAVLQILGAVCLVPEGHHKV